MAFSDAALHARGMNLIVMVNLVMACVLGVRVALKIAQAVLLIGASVFGALGFVMPAFWALVGPCLTGAGLLEQAINTTREPINAALVGLRFTQDGISSATPSAARAGAAVMIGGKYAPVIEATGAAHFGSETSLPVERGSQDKLCKEAGRTVGYFGGYAFENAGLGAVGGEPKKWLGDKLAWVATTSPKHFCEIGSEKGDANIDELFEEPAKQRCANQPEADDQALSDSNRRWQDKCREYGVTCRGEDERGAPLDAGSQAGTTSAARQAELDRLRLLRDQDGRGRKELRDRFGGDVPSSKQDDCASWAKDDMKRRQREQRELSNKQVPQGQVRPEGLIRPMQTASTFYNGSPKAQVGGGALVDASRLRRSGALVRVGAGKRATGGVAPIGASLPSWAQAEFFFDCGGGWAECNDDEEAMWHLSWRARLRRWNEPAPLPQAIAMMGLGRAPSFDPTPFSRGSAGLYGPDPKLRAELDRAVRASGARGIH